MLLPHLPLAASLAVFVACAAAIWIAGVSLSNYTEVLSHRLHLGAALGGLVLLAVATNLPEIAITITAAANGQIDIAVSNILGGIAIQTVVLVALDAFGVPVKRPLTYQAASLLLVLEGAVVVAILLVCVMGAQLPANAIAFRLTPDVVAIAVIWIVGLVLTQKAAALAPLARQRRRAGHAARAARPLDQEARGGGDAEGREHPPGRVGVRGRRGRHARGRQPARGERQPGRQLARGVRSSLRRDRAGGGDGDPRALERHHRRAERRLPARLWRHLRR